MNFLNLIATENFGKKNNKLEQLASTYGQAKLSLNANVLNGNLYIEDFTSTSVDLGFNLSIGMVYNSQAEKSWRLNQGKAIGNLLGDLNTVDSSVELIEADGHIVKYLFDQEQNRYVDSSNEEGMHTLTHTEYGWEGQNIASGIVDVYLNDKLQKSTDKFGRSVVYDYDTAGRLRAITSANAILHIEYTDNDVAIYRIENGQKTLIKSYRFDGVKLNKTIVPVDNQKNYIINYSYKVNTNLVESITQSDQTSISIEYADNSLSKITAGDSESCTITYKSKQTIISDGVNNTKKFAIDEKNRLQSIADDTHQITYAYDENGRIKLKKYIDDTQEIYSYDANGLCDSYTDRSGNTTYRYYDHETGLLLSSTTQLLITEKDHELLQKNISNFYSYNENKQLVYSIDEMGAVTQYDYDNAGNKINKKLYLGAYYETSNISTTEMVSPKDIAAWCLKLDPQKIILTEWNHNKRGQVEEERQYANINKDGVGVQDIKMAKTNFEFDYQNQLLSTTKVLDSHTTAVMVNQYDGLQRLTNHVDAVGKKTVHTYVANQHAIFDASTGLQTVITKNASDHVLSKINQSEDIQYNTQLQYDLAGRLVITTQPNGSKLYNVYDTSNRLHYQIDPLGYVNEYRYDVNDKRIQSLRYATPIDVIDESSLMNGKWQLALTGDCKSETYVYSAIGQLIFKVDGEGAVIGYQYDNIGNRISKIAYATYLCLSQDEWLSSNCPIATSNDDRVTRYFYNLAKQCVGKQLPNGLVVAFEYDAASSLTSKTYFAKPQSIIENWDITTIVKSDNDAHYTYRLDKRGQVLEAIDAENFSTINEWDAGGRKKKTARGDLQTNFIYDAANRVTDEINSTNLVTATAYATCGDKASISKLDMRNSINNLRSNLYRYDDFGNLTHELLPRAAALLENLELNSDEYENIWQQYAIKHTYSEDSLRTATKNELGNVTHFFYNKLKKLCFTVSPLGVVTENVYDAYHKKSIKTHHYAEKLPAETLAMLTGGYIDETWIDTVNELCSDKDAIVKNELDKRDLPIRQVDEEGYQTQLTYNAFGEIEALSQQINATVSKDITYKRDKLGRITTTVHDPKGLAISEINEYDDANRKFTHINGNGTISTTYQDKLGRKLRTEDADGIGVSQVLDANNRVISTTDQSNHESIIQYKENGLRKITTSFCGLKKTEIKNAFNEVIKIIDEDGNAIHIEHDVDGQISKTIDAEGQVTTKKYNMAGWLKSNITINTKTEYGHDKEGQVQNKIEVSKDIKRETVYKRDSRGHEIHRRDGNGVWTNSHRDKRGLITETVVDPRGLHLITTRAFDGLKNKISETRGDNNGMLDEKIYGYDSIGRVNKSIHDPKGLAIQKSKQYDSCNNVVRKIDANGNVTVNVYDKYNRNRYSIDALGSVTGKTYSLTGKLIEKRLYKNTVSMNDLDQLILVNLDLLEKSDLDIVNYYKHDADGCLIAKVTQVGSLTCYEYSKSGNKTKTVQYATRVKQFNAAQPNFAVPHSTDKDRITCWFYDKNGREKFKINAKNHVTEKFWNAEGLLVTEKRYTLPWLDKNTVPDTAQLGSCRTNYYFHDGLGRKIFEMNSGGFVNEFVYDLSENKNPILKRKYMDAISLIEDMSLQDVIDQLPADKSKIPTRRYDYDHANRKVSVTDELGYRKKYHLNALGKPSGFTDKAGYEWEYGYDTANRKIDDYTPETKTIDISINGPGSFTELENKQKILKKNVLDQVGNIIKISEGYGTPFERSLNFTVNAVNKITQTKQENVFINDPLQTPLLHLTDKNEENCLKPETPVTVITVILNNTQGLPIVQRNENGDYSFKVYGIGGELAYDIDQAGFVTAYSYNAFGEQSVLTRYDNALKIKFSDYISTGIPYQMVLEQLQPSLEDRSLYKDYDNSGKLIAVRQDEVFVYVSQLSGPADTAITKTTKKNIYNEFDEIIADAKLINPVQDKWETTWKWRNKLGQVVAEVDAENYLTLYTKNRYDKLLTKDEYAIPLAIKITSNITYDEIIAAVQSSEHDERAIYEYDYRGDLIKETFVGLQTQSYVLDDKNIPSLVQTPIVDVVTEYKRDANRNIIETIYPDGQAKITRFNAFNKPTLIASVKRTVEDDHHQLTEITPIRTIDYDTFQKESRITDHANSFENDAYLTPHIKDEIKRLEYDNRGLNKAVLAPLGEDFYYTYTLSKKIARNFSWVTGFADANKPIKRLYQTQCFYDQRDLETLAVKTIEGGLSVLSIAKKYNSFGEKIAEGTGEGDSPYPIYWKYNKTGSVWCTNEDSGISTIILTDARCNEDESVRLQSSNQDLNQITYDQLAKLVTSDFTTLQRTEIIRDNKGSIIGQNLPWFTSLAPDEPEPLDLIIVSGGIYPEFGVISLSWVMPEIAGLEPQITFCPTNHLEQTVQLPVITIGTRQGIDVSGLATNHYNYQIDFYYREPNSGQLEGHPRYRGAGTTLIATNVEQPEDSLVWMMQDESTLLLAGAIDNVSGIELLQDGKPVERIAVNPMDQPNRLLVDLSDQTSGQYKFRLLYGATVVDEVQLGEVSELGTRIDYVQTNMNQNRVEWTFSPTTMIFYTSWNNLPPLMRNLYHTSAYITSSDAARKSPWGTVYTDFGSEEQNDKQEISDIATKSNTIFLNFPSTHEDPWSIYNMLASSFGESVQSRLYTIDENNKYWTVGELSNSLEPVTCGIPPALYVQYNKNILPSFDAIIAKFPDDTESKSFRLMHWLQGSRRLISSPSPNDCNNYKILSLENSVTSPNVLGSINIHTTDIASKKLLAREINLKNVTCSKRISWIPPDYPYMDGRWGLNVGWKLPDDLNRNLLRATFQIYFNSPALISAYGSDNFTVKTVVGRNHHTAINAIALPPFSWNQQNSTDPTQDNTCFNLTHLQLELKIQDDWVPILDAGYYSIDAARAIYSFYSETYVCDTLIAYSDYLETDIASFYDTNTLWFYPLPTNIARAQIQYYDLSAGRSSIWQDLQNISLTGSGLAAPANVLSSGSYSYRLKAWDATNNLIDLSALATLSADGWATGEFTVTHGAALTVSKATLKTTVMKPTQRQKLNRWKNVVESKAPTGAIKSCRYTKFHHRLLEEINPVTINTKEDGTEEEVNSRIHYGHNIMGYVIGRCDENNHTIVHDRDYDGKTLKTIRADGVYKQFILDIFGNNIAIIDALDKRFQQLFDLNNRIIGTIDECGWPMKFNLDELGRHSSVTNGNNETDRYDYLQPLPYPTHHYQPLGQCTVIIRDRLGNNISQKLPDNREQTWDRDYFGYERVHQDLGGATYQFLYVDENDQPDYCMRLRGMTSSGGNHGERLFQNGNTVSQPGVDIQYQYNEANYTVGIFDDAVPLKTIYRIDIAGRRARETFIASDGHIHQAVCSMFNLRDWLVKIFDTKVEAEYKHDLKGNRRATIASVFYNDTWQKNCVSNWNIFTAADDVSLRSGSLINGVIQMQAEKGTVLTYDRGRRATEETIKSDNTSKIRTLHYLDNNLLSSVDSSDNDNLDFRYDGQVKRRNYSNSSSSTQNTYYNNNSWIESVSVHDKDQNTNATVVYGLNALGLADTQTTKVRTSNGQDGFDDYLQTKYVAFDNDKVIETRGQRYRMGVEKPTDVITVKASLDPNGAIESILGGADGVVRWFITNGGNRVVLKKIIDNDNPNNIKKENYFYTSDGKPLAHFGDIKEDKLLGALNALPISMDFDEDFHAASENFPPPAPTKYAVQSGDTFKTIADDMYGDVSYARDIARENGYSANDNPSVGETLDIPTIPNLNNHNWQGNYAPYNADAIIGGYYPNMPTPVRMMVQSKPKPKKSNFWHEFIEVLVGAVVFTVGIEFAPALIAELFTFLPAAMGTALTEVGVDSFLGGAIAGGFSSMAQQETSVLLKDQNSISWSNVGKSAALGGFGRAASQWIGVGAKGDSFLTGIQKGTELGLSVQAFAYATRIAPQFDWVSVASAVATGGADELISTYTQGWSPYLQQTGNDFANVVITSETNYALNHIPQDFEGMAANALGTIIGDQVGSYAYNAYEEYETEKQEEDEFRQELIDYGVQHRNEIVPGVGVTTAADLQKMQTQQPKVYQNSAAFFNAGQRKIQQDMDMAQQSDLANAQSAQQAQGAAGGSSATKTLLSQVNAHTEQQRLDPIERALAETQTINPYNNIDPFPIQGSKIVLDAAIIGSQLAPVGEVMDGIFASTRSLLSDFGLFADGGIGMGNKAIGLTTRLNRAQIKEYLANIHTISREQLIEDLESVGLGFKGSAEDGKFMSFVDKQGNVKVKIHPPDRVTQYDHIHIYNKQGEDLNTELSVVHYRSPEAHIQIAPDELNYSQEYYNVRKGW